MELVKRGVMLVGLAALVGCGDDGPDAIGDASSSSGGSTGSSGEPPVSTSSGSDETTSTGQADTTVGASATEASSTTHGETTAEPETGTTDGEASTTEPLGEPTAQEDLACTVRQRGPLFIDPLANDSDPQGSPLQIVAIDTSSTAGLVFEASDELVYLPPPGFWGEDSFQYTIADPDGNQATGEVHVMVWPGTIGADELVAGQHGFAISPDIQYGRLGWSVAGGGDLDGDGIDDLVVTAPFSNNGLGRSYVVFGRPSPTAVELAAVAEGQGGYVLQGGTPGEYAGWSVAVLDDLDGDGIDDLAVGAGWATTLNGYRSGRVFVVFSQAFGGTLELWPGSGIGFEIEGALPEDWAGWSVTGTGDMNGDGIGEVLLGAPQASDVLPGAPGYAYVVFGKGDALPVSLFDVLLGGPGGFAMQGQTGDHVGQSVAALPDLDGDGAAELLVGSELAAGGAGRAYVVHGHGGGGTTMLASVMNEVGGWGLEGAAPGLALGRSVAGIGDLDGDGLAELMVAAPGPALDGDAVVHVLSGANASSMVLGVPPPGQGTTLEALAHGDDLGWSVASLPDWNGDGLADLALGAPSAGGDFGPGAVYVVFGRPDVATIDLAEIAEGRGGFVVTGEDWEDDAGFRVASAGDHDGDGSTDLLIGAPQAEGGGLGANSGRAYVLLGVAPSRPELGACIPD